MPQGNTVDLRMIQDLVDQAQKEIRENRCAKAMELVRQIDQAISDYADLPMLPPNGRLLMSQIIHNSLDNLGLQACKPKQLDVTLMAWQIKNAL